MLLASLFQNGAVLQRNAIIPVWGKTVPSSHVCGEINGVKTFSRSSATGDFTLYFPEMEAGGPYTLEITAENDNITLNNILIGEVFLASGQSNMEYWLGWDRANSPDGNEFAEKQCIDFFKRIPQNGRKG